MELRRVGLVLVVLVCVLTALPSFGSEDQNDFTTWEDATLIARTMREYQGRWFYIYSGSPPWRPYWRNGPCCCDGEGVPAPSFPPDNFYRYCTDPNFERDPNAVDLVKNIVGHFYDMTINPKAIYYHFVHESYWDLEGKSDVPQNYGASDFPDIPEEEDVNEANYRDVLEALYETMTDKFKVMEEMAWYCDANDQSASDVNFVSCNAAKEDANSEWGDNWGSHDWPEPLGVIEWTYLHGGPPDSWQASKHAARFKIWAYLTHHTGDANCYVKITPWGDGWSNLGLDGLIDANNVWQTNSEPNSWGSPTVGEPNSWTSPYLANFPGEGPVFTSYCPIDPGEYNGWKITDSCILVWPVFNTDPNGFEEEGDPNDVVIYKRGGEAVAYAANPKCDNAIYGEGEVVDGNVIYEYDADAAAVELLEGYSPQAAELYINGWDGNGTLLTDPNKVLCYTGDIKSIPFSVKAKVMEDKADPVKIKFKVTFWDERSGTIYRAEREVIFEVKPNKGDICCNEEPCNFTTIKVGKAKEGVFCLYRRDPNVWVHNNNDIEVRLPDRETESYIMQSPSCGFLEGWTVKKSGADVNVVYDVDNIKYKFTSSSPYRLTSITDLEDNDLVAFEYDAYDRLIKQEDATDPNYYISYDYNDLSDFNMYPETIVAQVYDVNRVYTIEYDGLGRAVAVSSGTCDCGGNGAIRYVFDNNDLVIEKRAYDTNEVIYEYVYDSDERVTEKWLGPKIDANCVQNKVYTGNASGSIVDTYDYIDPSTYRVTREYKNSAGFVTKRINYEKLNEDPDDPVGESFVEHILYSYDANNVVTRKVVIPPLGDSDDPDPNSGIRKEYIYDPNTGRMLTEKWFDLYDANFTVVSYTYEYTPDGNNVRLESSTDARGAMTEYFYEGNELDPNLKVMPQVASGISGTKQLKYEYEYDIHNRVTLEKQLDANDVVIVQTKFEYDDYGNLVERYDAYGPSDFNEVTKYEYNGFNEMVKMTLPSGVIHGWFYNDSGKVEYEAVLDPCDPNNKAYSQTVYYFDGNGRVEKIKKADDPNVFVIDSPNDWTWTEYEYDLRGNKTKVIEDVNGLGLVTTYEYNHQGEVIKVTLPNGKWTRTIRDGRGLAAYTMVGHGGTAVAITMFYYDYNGNLEEQIAPNGIRTKYAYDDFDRLIKVTRGL